jgi:MFS family permease
VGQRRGAGIVGELVEGVRFAWREPVLRHVVGLAAIFNLTTAAFVPAFTFFLIREQDRTPGQLGLMLSIWAVGNLAGAVLAARLKIRRLGLLMLAGTAVFGIAMSAAVVTRVLSVFAALGFVVGVAYGTMAVSYVSLRAAFTPDIYLGRIVSLARTISVGMQPVGMLVGGLLIDAVGGGQTLALMGLVTILIAGVFGVPRALRFATIERT